MNTTDLDAVAIRRREVARFLSDYEKTRARLQAEIEELDITERVLGRLERLLAPVETLASDQAASEPVHRRAMSALKALIPGRGE